MQWMPCWPILFYGTLCAILWLAKLYRLHAIFGAFFLCMVYCYYSTSVLIAERAIEIHLGLDPTYSTLAYYVRRQDSLHSYCQISPWSRRHSQDRWHASYSLKSSCEKKKHFSKYYLFLSQYCMPKIECKVIKTHFLLDFNAISLVNAFNPFAVKCTKLALSP